MSKKSKLISPFVKRMPKGAKVLRKLRGKVTMIEPTDSVISLRSHNGVEVVGTISTKVLRAYGAAKKGQIFDYSIVGARKMKSKVIIRVVPEKKLTAKDIEKIKRQVDKEMRGLTEF